MEAMSKHFSSIIDSIYANILSHDDPCVIYMAIGCSGIMVQQEQIEKNNFYHQFPPALQNIYKINKNIKFYCIFIDEILEKPVFMTKDQFISNKLDFNMNEWKISDDEFMYNSPRITIYPLRKYIKINSVSHDHGINNSLDITQHLRKLHNIIIEQNIFYLYHDFSGINDYKKIYMKFYDQLFNHEDHIIYGLSNGVLEDCFPELNQPFAQIPIIIHHNENRDMIKTFNMDKIIFDYNIQNEQKNDNISFPIFLINYIKNSNFDFNSKIIICEQIKFFVKKFKDLLIGQILYFLRHMYDIQKRGVGVEIYMNNYHIEIFSLEIHKIYELYENHDNTFFEKIKKIVSDKFKIELILFAVIDDLLSEFNNISNRLNNDSNLKKNNYLNSNEIIDIITNNDDPYKWTSECLNFCRSL
jgi:hypothetical protein